MMKPSIAVLVLSCDKYSDIWDPFFNFFFKFWDDCPYPVYLGNNFSRYTHPRVKQVLSESSSSWSDELKAILEKIPEQKVLIILEDYFIYQKVDSNEINSLAALIDAENAGYLKLARFPEKYSGLWPSDKLSSRSDVGVIRKGARYRVCLQTGLWQKHILQQLLRSGESPWDFEIQASKRSNLLNEKFLVLLPEPGKRQVHGPVTYYCTALSAGKWMRGAVKLCQEHGIPIDLSKRPVESVAEEVWRKGYIALPLPFRKVVNFVSSRLRNKKTLNA